MNKNYTVSENTSASNNSILESQIMNNNKKAMKNLESNQLNHVLFYLNQALLACKSLGSLQGKERLLALTYNNLACYFQNISNSDKALEFLFKAVELMTAEKDVVNLCASHLNICTILSEKSQHERALRHALKCIYILRNNKNFPLSLIKAYFFAGTQYKIINSLSEAESCFSKGLALSKTKLGVKHELTQKLQKSLLDLSKAGKSQKNSEKKILRKFTPSVSKRHKFLNRSNLRLENSSDKKTEKFFDFNQKSSHFHSFDKIEEKTFQKKKNKLDSTLTRAQERMAAVLIQAWWRGALQRRKYAEYKLRKLIRIADHKAKIAVEEVNKLKKIAKEKFKIRAKPEKKFKQKVFSQIKALIKIQSTVKMFILHKKYKKILAACVKIQKFLKSRKYTNLYQKVRSAACFIQYMYRKYKKLKINTN